jgi:hypothetical protein
MSDTPNQDEPMIIKTDRPHSVSMPEGTNIAIGKKAEASAPAIRKVMAEGENFVSEVNNVIDGGEDPDKAPKSEVFAKGDVYKGNQNVADVEENIKGYQSAADAPDRFVNVPKDAPIPPPQSKPLNVTQLGDAPAIKDEPIGADTVAKAEAILAAIEIDQSIARAEPMPEMNFPARVIKIKIENDLVRERLDKLEE